MLLRRRQIPGLPLLRSGRRGGRPGPASHTASCCRAPASIGVQQPPVHRHLALPSNFSFLKFRIWLQLKNFEVSSNIWGSQPLISQGFEGKGRGIEGLDFVIYEAGKHRIKLILSLVNNYDDYGGKKQYVKWAKNEGHDIVSDDDDFFTNSVVKGYFKNHIKALKLSDNLHLNEIDCVRLLISANQECGLLGREPFEIYRVAAGLWLLFLTLVLTPEADLISTIQRCLEDLIAPGLRQRIVSLIKELKRENPTGLGGPNSESYILDSRALC